ncbi:hypothetical protein WOLCODRAFT_139798 [Wolfiporia cocos MD-104 SS10]|uniref:BHLH domain-containing protein n=1 Tax=Wolfiporia cocos (strain MD-104) TaxID=742152 RepID=A0A2H3IZP6_WOLCO|nr:hypothetical protein WOLCODRAFT_139798 [Wolfiporia cocos MD-104 SS10]
MNYHSQLPLASMQIGMDAFQNLMNGQDGTVSHGLPSQPQTTSQLLLEQQMRLNQLQQLQQLQNHIFQQQLELLSGQNAFAALPMATDRQREQQQQFGLPTPASSAELRAQPSPDYVPPMILQNNGMQMGGTSSGGGPMQNHSLHEFISQQMIPQAPHSAPANLVFQTNGSMAMSPSAEMDFSDITPLTSPWLGAYNNVQQAPGPSSRSSQPAPAVGNKRRNASSSGDESIAPVKPPRKRQSSTTKALTTSKKAPTRGTRSANSTPLFPAIGHFTSISGDGASREDVPNDTPSPIELPPMPPPAQLPPSVSASAPLTAASMTSSFTANSGHTPIAPVTPASIMKLGRLGTSSSLSPPIPSTSTGVTQKKVGTVEKGKSAAKATAAGDPSKSSRAADKASNVPLVSPSLKPIRPAGNATAIGPSSSPSGFAQPVVQFRKSSHKAAEQKRRDSLKTSFDDLRVLLPPIPLPSEEGYPDEPILPGAMPPRGPPKGNVEGPNRGVSKLQLLRCGNEYIKLLKGRVERRDDEISKLRREVARLRLLVDPEDARTDEELDLERDLDAGEAAGGGLLARAQSHFADTLAEEDGEEDGEA